MDFYIKFLFAFHENFVHSRFFENCFLILRKLFFLKVHRLQALMLCVSLKKPSDCPMNKDTTYYNNEGPIYSQKRYPGVSTEYIHFFFKRRKDILMDILSSLLQNDSHEKSLIEVGCADGVVIRSIHLQFKNITRLIGIDASPAMIETAKKISPYEIEFKVRANEHYGKFDMVVEVGVVNLTDFGTELRFAQDHMKPEGYYICTLASKTSLLSIFKSKAVYTAFNHLMSFKEYEEQLRKDFDITMSKPYGLFIPYIWKVPTLARIIQPLAETLLQPFVPRLFHEKIYLLKKKI